MHPEVIEPVYRCTVASSSGIWGAGGSRGDTVLSCKLSRHIIVTPNKNISSLNSILN